MLFKCQNILTLTCIVLASITLLSWKEFRFSDPSDTIESAERCLHQCFDGEVQNIKLKKWDIKITDNGFFRLWKYFPGGKQEYFSFNLNRLNDMNFLGTNHSGTLTLRTTGEDIIVQTYNDRKGDIDSMSSEITIPLKNIEAEQLNNLYAGLSSIKKK
jgi:hypothetical protein